MSTVTSPMSASLLPPSQEEPLYEIVNGQRIELPHMGAYATWLANLLNLVVAPFVHERRLGRVVLECLFVLDADKKLRRRPDLAFVSAERWPLNRVPPAGDWPVVPDLSVEVISPNDPYKEVVAKVREYFQHGVGQVWVVSPEERQIAIYESPTRVRILGIDDELADTIVPGLRFKLADIFPPVS